MNREQTTVWKYGNVRRSTSWELSPTRFVTASQFVEANLEFWLGTACRTIYLPESLFRLLPCFRGLISITKLQSYLRFLGANINFGQLFRKVWRVDRSSGSSKRLSEKVPFLYVWKCTSLKVWTFLSPRPKPTPPYVVNFIRFGDVSLTVKVNHCEWIHLVCSKSTVLLKRSNLFTFCSLSRVVFSATTGIHFDLFRYLYRKIAPTIYFYFFLWMILHICSDTKWGYYYVIPNNPKNPKWRFYVLKKSCIEKLSHFYCSP